MMKESKQTDIGPSDRVGVDEVEAPAARVLLVEDDPALRQVLRNVLEISGYHVQEADSKATAEAVLKQDADIAVIVLDLGLPPSPHTNT